MLKNQYQYLYLQYQTTINHEERNSHTVNATAKAANDTNENITLACSIRFEDCTDRSKASHLLQIGCSNSFLRTKITRR